jgi:hypothetical protein
VQASPIVVSNSDEETDKKLAAWFKKIMPALEKELKEGLTQVYDSAPNINKSKNFARLSEYQQIDVKSHFADSKLSANDNSCSILSTGATWLSVSIQNNPILAVACSLKCDFNEPTAAYLLIYEPRRNKSDGNIYWQETVCFPLKDPIDFLVTNPDNRDMFCGASKTGDFYIWNYNKSSTADNESRLIEIFAKTEHSITAITFLNNNIALCCSIDGSIIAYEIDSRNNCKIDKVMRIDQGKLRDSTITAIASINNSNDFVIGLLSGKVLYCTTNSLTTHDSISDPFVRELSSHKFAVKSLKNCKHISKNFIISIDVSSEIFIHEIEDDSNEKSLKYVIRLPLPIKNTIALTNDMEHFLCPLSNGGIEIFNSKSNTRRVIDGGNISGSNSIAELTKNE